MIVVMMLVGVSTMRVWVGHSCPTLSRRIFLPIHDHIDFGRGDAAAVYFRNFQARANVQGGYGFFEKSGRDSGVDEGSEEHVAADAGEAVEVGNAHRRKFLLHAKTFTTEGTEGQRITEEIFVSLFCVFFSYSAI